MHKRALARLAVAGWLLLAFIACGDDDDSSSGTAVRATDGEPLTIMLVDTDFEPSTIVVSTGAEVMLTLVNDGSVKHNFSIPDLPEQSVSLDVAAGKTESVTFTAPAEPGQYEIVCDEPGHEAAGMVGTLVVEE
jgi:plastocyanin